MIKIGKLYVAANPDYDENEEARKIQLTDEQDYAWKSSSLKSAEAYFHRLKNYYGKENKFRLVAQQIIYKEWYA